MVMILVSFKTTDVWYNCYHYSNWNIAREIKLLLCPAQLWRHTAQYVGELVLEGFARAGARTRCTVMGRSAMSLDLQVGNYTRMHFKSCPHGL
jgi:hypothetical protein